MTEAGGGRGPRYLVFGCNHRRFALELEHVAEIINLPYVVPVPLAPRAVEGIFNLRGSVLTALSLRELLKLGDDDRRAVAMVVLRSPEMTVAFAVTELVGVVHISTGLLGDLSLGDEGASPLIKAVFQHGGGPVNLIDAGRLVAHLAGGGTGTAAVS